MRALNDDLRFPKPPLRIDRSLAESPPPDQTVRSYLNQIRSWRSRVLAFLGQLVLNTAPEAAGLSGRAIRALGTFLAANWPPETTQYAAQSPYNISAFPASALESHDRPVLDILFDVLRWRAGAVDYLGDIWDVIGEPDLELFECNALAQFLSPVSDERMCRLCLTEFPPHELQVDRHRCVVVAHVRAKWPNLFPASTNSAASDSGGVAD
jgi:hypothetical protein